MSVAMAYLTVIIVWTTTPLGVTWSSETVSPTLAIFSRMVLAAGLGWGLFRMSGGSVSWKRSAVQKYLSADVGIVLAMYATYQGAGLIPSGLISVIYGLSPMISALFGQWLSDEEALPAYRWVACIISLFGLLTIFGQGLVLSSEALVGVLWLLLAVTLFSLSGVLVKRSTHQNGFVEQTVGSLICSVPLLAVIFGMEVLKGYVLNGSAVTIEGMTAAVDAMSVKSLSAILYLATMGSLVGFMCYFYVLSKMSASKVALVTLITPVMALTVGHLVNDEVVSGMTILGTALILLSLVLFNWGASIRRWIRLYGSDQSSAKKEPRQTLDDNSKAKAEALIS
ncbi:DMT family transporter [Litoribacillus peritrichatus]|uniref:DMT family transporter n=1 Tax=Litoribacillus peritrichatus TaxID=718191 RepID=A0ABP7NA03_9GAMM